MTTSPPTNTSVDPRFLDHPFTILIVGPTTMSSSSPADRDYIFDALDQELSYYLLQGFQVDLRTLYLAGACHTAYTWGMERGYQPLLFGWPEHPSIKALDSKVAACIQPRSADKSSYAASVEAAVRGVDGDGSGGGSPHPYHRRKSDLLIAFWDGQSPETRYAMACARNSFVFIHRWGGGQNYEFRTPYPQDLEIMEYRGEDEKP